jgi:hypothetical protein
MKKENLKGKLMLKKDVVSKLSSNQLGEINGGRFTGGCTDGCTSKISIRTLTNCTDTNCTNDCDACYTW